MTVLAWRFIHKSFVSVRTLLAIAVLTALLSSALAAQIPQSSAPPLPDQNEPSNKEHHDQMSTKDVKEKLEKALDNKNAAYEGSAIQVAADDQTVTLTGAVKSSMQHEMAMQLARAYAGNRKVVDQLTIH